MNAIRSSLKGWLDLFHVLSTYLAHINVMFSELRNKKIGINLLNTPCTLQVYKFCYNINIINALT